MAMKMVGGVNTGTRRSRNEMRMTRPTSFMQHQALPSVISLKSQQSAKRNPPAKAR